LPSPYLGKPTQGSMRRQRRSTYAIVVALLVAGATAQAASASSLLSGYGTPGEGNQAILGSALLGGPSGGGGGRSGTGSGAQGGSAQEAVASEASAGPARGGSGSTAQSRATGRHTGNASISGTGRPAKGPGGRARSLVPTAATGARASTPALGITGTDLMYILIGVGGLLLTGIFTRQLVHRPG
jgi:hypothetical protein